jgi:hypothetical protein
MAGISITTGIGITIGIGLLHCLFNDFVVSFNVVAILYQLYLERLQLTYILYDSIYIPTHPISAHIYPYLL